MKKPVLGLLLGAVLGAYLGSHDKRSLDYVPADDVETRLRRLETLRTRGLLTEGEYEQRRAATLETI